MRNKGFKTIQKGKKSLILLSLSNCLKIMQTNDLHQIFLLKANDSNLHNDILMCLCKPEKSFQHHD